MFQCSEKHAQKGVFPKEIAHRLFPMAMNTFPIALCESDYSSRCKNNHTLATVKKNTTKMFNELIARKNNRIVEMTPDLR